MPLTGQLPSLGHAWTEEAYCGSLLLWARGHSRPWWERLAGQDHARPRSRRDLQSHCPLQAPPQPPNLPTDGPLNGSSISQQCHSGDQALDMWASRGHSRPKPWHLESSPGLVQEARPHLPALAGAPDSGSAALAASLQAQPVERQDGTQRAVGQGVREGGRSALTTQSHLPAFLGSGQLC